MEEPLIRLEDIHAAQKRIAGTTVCTGLYHLDAQRLADAGFSIGDGAPSIWIKAENEQPIGSFKLRGAYNKIASLDAETLQRGVITYSSGNHAQGVAYAARKLHTKAVIVMPNTAPKIKQEATRALGGEVIIVGPASSERRQKAEALQKQFGYTMVPPYDDNMVIAGQATCGMEILEQRPGIGLILSPVSGGGLLSGTAAAAKLSPSSPLVFGIEPELSGDAAESFRTGQLVEWTAEQTSRTIADGLRTQSLGKRNFALITRFVYGIITVTEEEILQATRLLMLATDLVAEPSGAVTLAGALFHWKDLPQVKEIAIILSGGNLDPSLKDRLLATETNV